MRKNKNLAKVLLAGALAASLAVPVSAAPGDTTGAETEQDSPAVMETNSVDGSDFIVFLPTEDGVEYTYDTSHMSEAYSTSDYTVLLYRPGETVSFQVTSEKDFSVEDALQGTEFTDASILDNGVVAFVMPEIDLCCNFSTEEESEEDSDGAETAEPGTFKVKLGKNLSANCSMVDKSSMEIERGGEYQGSGMVDLIRVSSEEDLTEAPSVRVFKNGERLEDTSGVVISEGLSKGTYVIDFKNSLPLDSDSYVVKISMKGNSEETEAQSDTESSSETVPEAETEAADNATEGTNIFAQMVADMTAGVDMPGTGTYDESQTEQDMTAETAQQAPDVTEDVQTESQSGLSDIQAGLQDGLSDIQTEAQSETMSEIGAVGDDYQEDTAVSSLVSGFASTVRETAVSVNVSVSNHIPDAPVVIKKSDGTIETAYDSYLTDEGISSIEIIGDVPYEPEITVLKDGEELDDADSIVVNKEYLANGNLFMELRPAGELQSGNYEIEIG